MAKQTIDIEYIIIWRNLNEVASDSEKQDLQNWLDRDDKHRRLYEHLKVSNEREIVFSNEHIEMQWQKMQEHLDKRPDISLKRWIQYAAAIALPLLIATSVILLSDKEDQPKMAEMQIQPGATKALLQLADGSYINLDAESKQTIRNQQGEVIGSDSLDVLSYYQANQTIVVEYNTIRVPRGGEYNLRLADGTHVWLNAETELTYPTHFTGDKREVKLIGEAYFDVTTNKAKPFIVKTNHSAVKVYGTQFNVMSYANEAIEQTTLVEGSIAVLHNNKEVMVQPGQQAQLLSGSSQLEIRQVDTDLYTDWKNGIFRFEEMALKDVTTRLSRWYDVNFFFTNEAIKTRTISGAMKRSTDFSLFMSLIEKSAGAEISIEGNSVVIEGRY